MSQANIHKFRVEKSELKNLNANTLFDRIRLAVNTLEDLSAFESAENKQYAIDQAVKVLLKDEYSAWVESRSSWSKGISP